MSPQPTILVKKSDGTSVRMTMEEFKAYKNKTQNTNNTTQTTKPALPMKETPMPPPATTAPVKKIFEDEAKANVKTEDKRLKIINTEPKNRLQVTSYKLQDKKTEIKTKSWEQVDNKPLLHEDVVGARKQEVIRTTLPDSRGDAFDAVIRNLKFPVRDELRPRLKSLIVSRVKDIRTDEQVGEYAMRTVENGGLGWSQDQVEEFLQMIKQTNKTQNANNITQTSDSRKQITDNKVRTQNPDNRTPSYKLQDISYKIQAGGEKPVLHDVVAPVVQPVEQKVGMGPMEEFASFQMIDFRRLGGAVQAGEVMRKKFETMRAESLVLYLRAVKAWRESPLYRQYQKILTDAVSQSRVLKELVAAIGWKWEEFEEISKICSSL